MASACALAIFSGKYIFIFAILENLRIFQNCLFTGGDVEDEVNGLFTYDRTAIKPDANAVRSVNATLAAEFARVVK